MRIIINKVQAVIYDIKYKKPYFLIMHRKLRWKGWELVKGTVELKDKDLKKAIRREVKEETGLKNFKIVKDLKKKFSFNWGKTKKVNILKVFLIKANMKQRIKLKQRIIEHDGYLWCDYETTFKKLTYDNAKNLIKAANRKIRKKTKY